MKKEVLYKYRGLSNLKRFLEIILNKKLYGALYTELNDPMEGSFRYNYKIPHEIIEDLKDQKQKTYICSLSKKNDIGIMWTHYAEEHKGCCIEIEVTAKSWERIEVKYQSSSFKIADTSSLSDILKIKSIQWNYEEEVRYIKTAKDREALYIKIQRIFLGYKLKASEFNFYKKLIQTLDPSIEVVKMKKESLDFGYKE